MTSLWGLSSMPFDRWLAERGLAMRSLRMRTACADAAALADWLGVRRLIYPGGPDHPDHEIAGRVLSTVEEIGKGRGAG